MYLLAAQHPNDINFADSMFFKVTSILYKFSSYNIIYFRFIGLSIILSSAFILFIGIAKYTASISLKNNRLESIDILFVIINGTLLYYSLLPTPSYNLLNTASVYTGVGLLLFSLSDKFQFNESLRSRIALILLGFVITFDFFIKFSSSIMFLSIVVLVFFLIRKSKNLMYLLLGSGISLLMYFFFIQSVASWKKIFFDGMMATTQLNEESIFILLKNNFNQIAIGLKDSTENVFFIIFPLLIQNIIPRKFKLAYSQVVLLLIFVFLPFVIVYLKLYQGGAWPKVPSEMILSFFIVSAVIYLQTQSIFRHLGNINLLILIFLLIITPFVGAIGTGVPIMGGIIECIASWPVLIYIMNKYLSYYFNNGIYKLLTIYLMLVITLQVITSETLFPYRLNTSIFDQKVPISIGDPPSVLNVDTKLANFFISLRSMINKNKIAKNEKYILAFCDMPGFVFFLGKRSPSLPWYLGEGQKYNRLILESTPPSLIKHAIIITNPAKNDCMPDLKEFGIDFPKQYSHVGHLEYPRLWWNTDKQMVPIDIWIPSLDHLR